MSYQELQKIISENANFRPSLVDDAFSETDSDAFKCAALLLAASEYNPIEFMLNLAGAETNSLRPFVHLAFGGKLKLSETLRLRSGFGSARLLGL